MTNGTASWFSGFPRQKESQARYTQVFRSFLTERPSIYSLKDSSVFAFPKYIKRYVPYMVKSKLKYPPPRAYPGHLISFPAREGGNLMNLSSPGRGIWSLLIGGGEFDRYNLFHISSRADSTLRDLKLLSDFKPWRTRYESVNYGISNYWSA